MYFLQISYLNFTEASDGIRDTRDVPIFLNLLIKTCFPEAQGSCRKKH